MGGRIEAARIIYSCLHFLPYIFLPFVEHSAMRFRHSYWLAAWFVSVSTAVAQDAVPKVSDPRLVVELVAAAPDIVHPISCDFDHKGRLLVIESHTHFAPKDYKGPKFD